MDTFNRTRRNWNLDIIEDEQNDLLPFNRTRRNWNIERNGEPEDFSNLLIVPEGIEMRILRETKA